MHRRLRTLAALTSVLAPIAAHAAEPSEPSQPEVIRVQQNVRRTLADNCRLTVQLRGQIGVVHVPGATADNATQYRPDIAARTTLECPYESKGHVSAFGIVGAQYSAEQLTQTLSERQRFHVRNGARICTVEPQFVLDARSLRFAGIARRCELPRGGGPTSPGARGIEGRPGAVTPPSGAYERPTGIKEPSAAQPRGGGPRDVVGAHGHASGSTRHPDVDVATAPRQHGRHRRRHRHDLRAIRRRRAGTSRATVMMLAGF
jgi:hypothetical protein